MKTKKKLKTIMPTLRGKKRYLSFRIVGDNHYSRGQIEEALWDNFLSLYGSFGCAEIRLWLTNWDSNKNEGIIRYALVEDIKARAGIQFIKEIAGKHVSIKIVKVSGAINKLKNP